MKKTTIILLATCMTMGMNAQSIYDAANIARKDLNGTARFVGMGGAMSALGGDISTIGTNPAGIGIYRSNDAMLTFGYFGTNTESNYGGNVFGASKNRWSFDNAGFVLSSKVGNVTALRYVNFAFNYHKSKSFYKNMSMEGLMGMAQMGDGTLVPVSQARYMAQQASNAQAYLYRDTGEQFNFDAPAIYDDPDAGWLGAIGYQGWLMDEYGGSPYYYLPIVPSEAYGYFYSRERGGIDQYDFNVAFNVNDRFYFGMTLGVYDVDYSKYSLWDESYDTNEGYSLESFNSIHGAGVDLKLGTIIRPFAESSFRIGFSLHTPIFYSLTYTTGALLTSNVLMTNNDTQEEYMDRITVDTYNKLGGRDMDRDFNLQTPWLVNASLGYTIGSNLALGAEYEYEDYSTMKFKYPDGGGEMWHETGEARAYLKGVHTVRVGAEFRPVSPFAIRAGYNYSTAAYDDLAIKYLPDNSINTDTDYANDKEMHNITLGIGYRWSSFYADLSYQLQTYKSDFYPFFNEFSNDAEFDYTVDPADYGNSTLVTLQPTKVTNKRSQVLLTLGFRF